MNIKRSLLSFISIFFGAAFLPIARECGAFRPGVFFEPDNGGGSGGGKPKGTLEEQLATAQNELTTAKSSLDAITKERDGARNESANLKKQFDEATKSANEMQTKVTELTGQLETSNKNLTETNGKLTKSTENITRLESLCGVKGIDPNKAVPASNESGPTSEKHVLDQWNEAQGPAKSAIYHQHKAEIRAEAARRERATR